MYSENPDLFADPDEDDFFDAKEMPSVSPTSSRRFAVGGKRLSGKEMEVKVEELDLENKSLKEVGDKLSKRLHAFEMAAQNSSMALQESMRMMRPMSPMREASGGENALRKRVAELEEHVTLGGKEIERLGKENEKLKGVVARYRERWEKLKEGAKTRQEGRKEGSGKDGQGKKDDPGAGRFVAG
jgi:chromosome segregation ATPase